MRNRAGLSFVDHQLPVFDIISERRIAAHPYALFLGRRDFVTHTLADDLSLELREGQEHIQRQPTHTGRRVELLRDRHKRDAEAVEDVHELGKIGQGPRQPINLIDHDNIDLTGLDVGESLCKAGRSIVPPEYPPSSYSVGNAAQPS
jgi:hypothetical protein